MAADKADVLLIGPKKSVIVDGLKAAFNLHAMADARDSDAFISGLAPRVRAIAVSVSSERVDGALMARLPKLEIVSTFAVGYDHIDAKWAGEHGITVTNTPGVLTEEVADTALGLLLCTVREFPQADRYLRAGKCLPQPTAADGRALPALSRSRRHGA
jgi:lactate dehydrogenase-like 2-hydroxyacid dehydrogenase